MGPAFTGDSGLGNPYKEKSDIFVDIIFFFGYYCSKNEQ
jgi:hypothetical protein